MVRLFLPTLIVSIDAHGYLSIPMQAGRKGCPGAKSESLEAGGHGPADCSLTDGYDRSWFTDKARCPGEDYTDDDWVEEDHGDGDIVHNLKKGKGVSSCPGKAEINSMCGWHAFLGHDCGGATLEKANTDPKHFDGCDGRAKLNAFGGGGKVTKWKAGSTQTVAWSVATPHGGMTSYSLCHVDDIGKDYHRGGATSKCFDAGRLKFAHNRSCAWTAPGKEWSGKGCYETKMHNEYWQESWPKGWQHDKKKYDTMGVQSEVIVPSDLRSGRYVIAWEWDTDGGQIWQSCADIEITGGGPSPAPTPEPTPEPTPAPSPTPAPAPVGQCTFKTGGTVDKNAVLQVNVANKEECCGKCAEQGECTHFTFVEKTSLCTMRSGTPEYNDAKNRVSGEMEDNSVQV